MLNHKIAIIKVTAEGNKEKTLLGQQNFEENYFDLLFMSQALFQTLRSTMQIDNMKGFENFVNHSIDYSYVNLEIEKDVEQLFDEIELNLKSINKNEGMLVTFFKNINKETKDDIEKTFKIVYDFYYTTLKSKKA